ncbi:cysteine desulfurase [Patescibacteria group bacterium]|nr:cysteine desulfurase [Patescibacteria group bacterium]
MKVYLDNSATTALDLKVLKAMRPYFNDKFGNASSIHSLGQESRQAVDRAREIIAKRLNCLPQELIFTSGGTESDNLVLRGLVKKDKFKPHFIVSKIEHHAVLKTVESLVKENKIEATYVGVDKTGRVNPDEIKKAIKRETTLISIIYVNNETGVIEPIREIGKMIEKFNLRKKRRIYFHTDAVQAAGYLDLNVDYLHVDLLTLSAHKIYGPKGAGLLYARQGITFTPQITGGEQEDGRRAGTENVAGIVGMAEALKIAASCQLPAASRIKKLRDYLEKKIITEIKDVKINGDLKNRAPHISNISFKGAEGESIILSLDLEGIAVSSGSACTSGSLEPSHVLMAMGIDPFASQSSIRFSLGKDNTKREIDYVVDKLKLIIKRLRRISAI